MNTIFFKEKPSLDSIEISHYLWLLAILIVGFLIRFWILDQRWINPDEGAHIMDGRLVLDGLVPKVDYDSRQPFYVYIIAIILKIFGSSYVNVRLFLPFICSLGVALFVFLISRKLFNNRIALLSSAIYTFLPLSIVESVIVKTEPLTTLLSSIGIYLVFSAVWDAKRPSLLFFLSGIFLSLAYYVRESSLSILLAVFFFFVVAYWRSFHELFRNYVIILAGFLSVCLLAFAYYGQYMSFNQLLESPINPLNIVFDNIKWVLGLTEARAGISETSGFNFTGQPWSETLHNLHLTLFSNSPLFAGLIFSILIFINSLLAEGTKGNSVLLKFSLLYSWIFSLALAYAYWTIYRGYFIQYFEELLPPLSILLAFVIVHSLSIVKLNRDNGGIGPNVMASILVILLVMMFFLNRGFTDFRVNSVFYFLLAILAVSFFYFTQEFKLGRWLYKLFAVGIISAVLLKLASFNSNLVKVPVYLTLFALIFVAVFKIADLRLKRDYKKALGFITFSILIFSFLLSFAVSGRRMGLDFDCVWSPQTVSEVSDYIRANSMENDEIISGGVIWELQSDRRPFMNQSHPQVYSFSISQEVRKNVEWHLTNHPPKFIVLDGYTEKTYLRQFNKLQIMMEEQYRLKKVVDGSRYPVKIYELRFNNLSME